MTFPLSPWARLLGQPAGSGAIPPVNEPAFSGNALVLGSDAGGVFERIDAGGYFEASQIGDLTANAPSYLRLRYAAQPRKSGTPAGLNWRLAFSAADSADGTAPRVVFNLLGRDNRHVRHVDVAIPLTGVVSTTRGRILLALSLQGPVGTYPAVELPGVWVDSLVLDASATLSRPSLINRLPEPNETGVPVDTLVQVEINDPYGATLASPGNIDLTRTKVYVNGALAYDGSQGTPFQAGFNGAASAVTALDSLRTQRIVIQPTTSFGSTQLVNVQVASAIPSGQVVTQSYSFTTAQILAPTMTNAVSTDSKTIRVYLSEPIVAVSATATNDALNPQTWALSIASLSLADGLPAFLPTIASVAMVTSSVFDLTLSDQITRGAKYLVSGLFVDLFGNPAVSPSNGVVFVGFTHPVPDARDFQLTNMVPSLNINEDETQDLQKFLACLQEVLDGLLADVDDFPNTFDPDLAAEIFIDQMLKELGNPFGFVGALQLVDKRRLLHALVPIYQLKGTDPGIIQAILFFLGLTVTITPTSFAGVWVLGVSRLDGAVTSTTVASGSNGVVLSTFAGSGVLNVASAASFAAMGYVIFPNLGGAIVSYTAKTSNMFAGCKLVSGGGTLATGQTVNASDGIAGEVSGTVLGSSNLKDQLSFSVVSPITLTADQVAKITAIVNYMKDARTHFLGVIQPAPPPPTPNDWELGLSFLGQTTLLH